MHFVCSIFLCNYLYSFLPYLGLSNNSSCGVQKHSLIKPISSTQIPSCNSFDHPNLPLTAPPTGQYHIRPLENGRSPNTKTTLGPSPQHPTVLKPHGKSNIIQRYATADVLTGDVRSRLYQSPGWIPHGADLRPSLPQNVTNGKSILGTRRSLKVRRGLLTSMFYGHSSAASRVTDVQCIRDSVPITGVLRKYKFSIGYKNASPDTSSKLDDC